MDARITKKRLAHMLSYDWIKVLLSVAAAIFVWVMVFTVSATRITNTQRFVVMNYMGMNYGNGLKIYDVYSHEILEAEPIDNMRGGEQTFQEIFNANIEIGEGDVLMVANAYTDKTEKQDENGETLKDAEGNALYDYSNNYFETFVKGYWSVCTRLDDSADGLQKGYFTQMKEYLGAFYEVTGEQTRTYGDVTLIVATFGDDVDEAAVEAAFRQRVKATKDKRFKKEEQIAAGVLKDVERIEAYKAAYESFFQYLDAGYVTLTTVSYQLSETFTLEGAYGVNLCPSGTDVMDSLKEQMYYYDADDKMTAKETNAVFLRLDKLDLNYQYENLLYLNALIEDVCTAL